HSYADAKRLARQLPDARLIRTRTFAELWVTPARLTAEIADFLDRVWADGAPGNPVRPREAALPALTRGRGLAGSSWPASVGRRGRRLPPGRRGRRFAPGRRRGCLPPGPRRGRLPPGGQQQLGYALLNAAGQDVQVGIRGVVAGDAERDVVA